eukprot:3395029-Rhodomonas_salina.2
MPGYWYLVLCDARYWFSTERCLAAMQDTLLSAAMSARNTRGMRCGADTAQPIALQAQRCAVLTWPVGLSARGAGGGKEGRRRLLRSPERVSHVSAKVTWETSNVGEKSHDVQVRVKGGESEHSYFEFWLKGRVQLALSGYALRNGSKYWALLSATHTHSNALCTHPRSKYWAPYPLHTIRRPLVRTRAAHTHEHAWTESVASSGDCDVARPGHISSRLGHGGAGERRSLHSGSGTDSGPVGGTRRVLAEEYNDALDGNRQALSYFHVKGASAGETAPFGSRFRIRCATLPSPMCGTEARKSIRGCRMHGTE